MSRIGLLLLVLLGAVVGGGKARQAAYDREDDDDFAEFDFDVEEEWEGGEVYLLLVPPPRVDSVPCHVCRRF